MYDVREAYLETQVSTATPQKLRLMLIEGAIRFAHQAQAAWQDNRPEDALEAGGRCRGIIVELIAGIRVDGSQLSRQVAGLYAFVFRTLNEAQLAGDAGKLGEVVRVLDEERVTWLAVCDQMPDAPDRERLQKFHDEEIVAPQSGGIATASFGGAEDTPALLPVSSGFSIDA